MPGEFDFIDWIRAQTPRFDHVLVGPGDDLAVLKWIADDLLVVGVDQVLDGVHFDSALHLPAEIGRKVMNRNLSDCAAMACLPAAAVATVALPKFRDIEYAKEIFRGMKHAAEPFNFPLVGGDTASWDGKLVLTVTILGRSAGVEPVRRSGAKVGDAIYVTGPLGGSLLGRHMTFTPRIELARQFARQHRIHAMVDISDGLSRDLRHICQQSSVGAIIDADRIPIHEDAVTMSRRDGKPPLDHALHNGEDHELLFTGDAPVEQAIRIGTIVEGEGIVLRANGRTTPLDPKGWEHRM